MREHNFSFVSLPMFAAAGLMLVSAFATGNAQQPAKAGAQQLYHIVDRWKLGGDGGWDYLLADSAAHRLYITHGPRVEVIDSQTGKQIGAITGLRQAGAIGRVKLVAYDSATAEVNGFKNGQICTSLATLATVPAGTNPDGIVFEPATQTVWAFNGRSKDVTVIDAATRKVVATIPLPGKPEYAAVDGNGTIFNNIEDKSEIVRLDAHARKITAEWPTGCDSPSGLAFDIAGHRLFAVCDGKKMSVLDSTSGKQIATAAIGDGPDAARYSPGKNLAFASCGEGILSVVDASQANYPTMESLPTQRGARTMAYDPAPDRVYVVTADLGPRPAATAENPHPRPAITPGSFHVIVIGR
jgi:YVTN family beta-propeller protein